MTLNPNEAQIANRHNPEYIFSTITRSLNTLTDSDKQTKKQTSTDLYTFICQTQPSLKPELIQELLIKFNTKLIKFSFYDKIDKVRENLLKTLIYMYSFCTNAVKFFPFIFSSLVDKLDCNDLEGFGNLPEDIRPTPSQNPHIIIRTTEPIEEIRLLYIKLLHALIQHENATIDDYRLFVQDIVNISRTLCMDTCTAVAQSACDFVAALATRFSKDLLFYFNAILNRGLLYALSHKQAKLRLAALNAVDKLVYCSPFKSNVQIMEQLVGFRDPHLVPIKDFYEPSTKFNYFAFLSCDANQIVLKRFYEVISSWTLLLEDRNEFEPRVLPYMLTGLFDKNSEIALYVSERFALMGKQYEIDNEKELREQKQYGVDSAWCVYVGNKFDTLIYPFPLTSRPSLGCRKLVSKYLRRYIKNICTEFEGIDENIKFKVANLLLYSIAYSEDVIVEYLDQVLLLFERDFIKTSNHNIDILTRNVRQQSTEINTVLIKGVKLLGRFCSYEALTNLLYPTVKGELNGGYPDIQRGALITLKHVFIGHVSSACDGVGMFRGKLKEYFSVIGVDDSVTDFLDTRAAFDVVDFYNDSINALNVNKDKMDNNAVDEVISCLDLIFMNIVHCLGANEYLTTNATVFKYVDSALTNISKNVTAITKGVVVDYFAQRTQSTLEMIYAYLNANYISLQNKYYKILYVLMKSKLFFARVPQAELLKLLLKVFAKIFENDENFNVHSHALNVVLSFLQQEQVLYKASTNKSAFMYNTEMFVDCIEELMVFVNKVLQAYTKIDGDEFKFKFIDLLKEQKELEKKRMKSPRTLKTELRRCMLLFLQNVLNKTELFSITNTTNNTNNSNTGLPITKEMKLKAFELLLTNIFNSKDVLKYFMEEAENLRIMFNTIYHQYLVKLFVLNNKDNNVLKRILPNFEEYFIEEVYDQAVDVRKGCFNMFNLVLGVIPISGFYAPMRMMYKYKESDDETQYKNELMKALSYVDQESKMVEDYFCKFKNIVDVIVDMYLNDKSRFGIVCDNAMKLIIERFPIYVFNDLMKAQKKNQIARIEFFNMMLGKHLK